MAYKYIEGIIVYQIGISWSLTHYIVWTVVYLLAALSLLAVIILVALKNFPVFKPLLDKLNARKEQRAQLKAERAEEEKQARIAELEAELEELKKD